MLSVDNPAPVVKEDGLWRRTEAPYRMDHKHRRRLTKQRRSEWGEIQDYLNTDSCLMAFLTASLDDASPKACGRCSVCLGRPVVDSSVDILAGAKLPSANVSAQSSCPWRSSCARKTRHAVNQTSCSSPQARATPTGAGGGIRRGQVFPACATEGPTRYPRNRGDWQWVWVHPKARLGVRAGRGRFFPTVHRLERFSRECTRCSQQAKRSEYPTQ